MNHHNKHKKKKTTESNFYKITMIQRNFDKPPCLTHVFFFLADKSVPARFLFV